MLMNKDIDWIDLATKAGYLYRSPHITGGMIYGPEGLTICDRVNKVIREEFEKEGFSLWSFSNRVAREDLEILSSLRSDNQESTFDESVHWVSRDVNTDLPREALRPAGESQVHPFWAQNIQSYRQFEDFGKIMIQQRFFRAPPKGHRTSTRFEYDVSEGHALFETPEEADAAMLKYLLRNEAIADKLGIPFIAVESPVWDNNHFNERSAYLCSILDGAVRLLGSAYNQGRNLSERFGISYQDKSGQRRTPHVADWGIGPFYPTMWHSRDENGFVFPFGIGSFDICLIQIGDSSEVSEYVGDLNTTLSEQGYRVKVDTNRKLGKCRQDWELRGYPIRIEVGEKELKDQDLPIWHRWEGQRYEPTNVPAMNLLPYLEDCKTRFAQYLIRRTQTIKDNAFVFSPDSDILSEAVSHGFVGVFNWCGQDSCIEAMYGGTNPRTQERENGLVSQGKFLGWNPHKRIDGECVSCGKSAHREGYWSRRKQI
jgi:prolyl-tRNA synthetase